jgi:hypothetical protein
LYVDDLLACCGIEAEAFIAREIKGAGSLQLPERRCAMIRRAACHLLYRASQNRRLICSKDLKRFTGQAVSALSAIPLALFRLRSIYNCQQRFHPRSF